MSRFVKFLVLLLVTLLIVSCKSSPFSSISQEKVLHGQVIDVLDGDTVKLRSDWHIYKIRLAGIDAATKNIDKSVYVLEIFLVHRTRSRCLERQATSVCIALRRRKFPTSHRYIYRAFCY